MIKPQIITNLFDQVQKLIPEKRDLFIAGGCVRDLFNECSSFKDIDFFVDTENSKEVDFILNNLKNTFGLPKNLTKDEHTRYENIRNIVGIYEFKHRFDSPFQIVCIKKKRDSVNFINEVLYTFDFNINCSYYTPESGFKETFKSKGDRINKLFTINYCANGHELNKIVLKYNRLIENKYKDYRLNYNEESFRIK